jgi:hypothetical protein
MPHVPMTQLYRFRWAVRATLFLGVSASVAANILHAEPNPVSQVIAAWPPLALLLTVELISRVPVHRRYLAVVRLAATAAIASIAAWVSYWHMAGVAARYGETGASPYLMPLSVDGLVIVASVSLVELAGRIREAEDARAGVPVPQPAAPRPAPMPMPPPAPVAVGPMPPQAVPAVGTARVPRAQPHRITPTRHEPEVAPRQRRPVAETAALAARIEAEQPDVKPHELAAQLGISTSRLRAIRREVRTG